MQEITLPIYFVMILALIRLSTNPSKEEAVESFPEVDLTVFAPNLHLGDDSSNILFISPNTDAVQQFVDSVLTLLHARTPYESVYKVFATADDAEDAYRDNSSYVTAGIDFKDGSLSKMEYTIRMPYGSIAKTSNMYSSQGVCSTEIARTMFVSTTLKITTPSPPPLMRYSVQCIAVQLPYL